MPNSVHELILLGLTVFVWWGAFISWRERRKIERLVKAIESRDGERRPGATVPRDETAVR